MRQNRLFSLLGGDLRDSRRALSMTQADLASRVGCSLPTTRQLEQGRGTLAVLTVAASILGVHLNGRNLPGGTTVGIRLATLRQRRGLSRRAGRRNSQMSAPPRWRCSRLPQLVMSPSPSVSRRPWECSCA